MNDTLKVAGRIGAELGAAKAEVERLREALRWYEEKVTECRKIGSLGDNARQALDLDGGFRARDALSQQAEPTDTYTAVDMATAAAQGFRDGQAAAEQAPAQDEKAAFEAAYRVVVDNGWTNVKHMARQVWDQARTTRPAQAEQQPVCWASSTALAKLRNGRNNSPCVLTDGPAEFNDTPLYAIAQTAPQPEHSELADTLLRQVELRNEVICELYAEFSRGGTPNWEPIFERAMKLVVYAMPEPARSFALSKSASPQPEQSGLVEALKPFAAIADQYDAAEDDSHQVFVDAISEESVRITLGQCRNARAALSATPSPAQRGEA
ncbi:hypothetical protein BAY1663_02292 [Pseudomonas sp. BAY1663]|uniref:hypothetical protein n=1 Tax=Pseudomonas sp. BAY1663 TaxID=1439940 RepID=UPI00042E0902|nr:hypothetical protein [Pseudomonas sp. BAY1663]EXF45213.1 hypothetical protein BAY1663_02292 [Pseudomonas sp. BAY1663]